MDAEFQVIDVAPGLWIWRMPHPDWAPPDGGDRVVTSTVVASGGEIAVLDPLAPPPEAPEIWDRLHAQPPTMAVVLKPDHVRSIDAFVERFGCRAYGPEVYYLDDLPTTAIEPVWVGDVLPGGLMPLYDGRSRNEWPMWLPEQRAIVFAECAERPRRRAPGLGIAMARAGSASGPPRLPRPAIRTGHHLARQPDPRPGRVRARPRSTALRRDILIASCNPPRGW